MEEQEDDSPGIPAWVMTFADLMSLLMCFFVLLLSFSEIDARKFKQIAGELSAAFGVQREVPALEIPMGTSPIFDKFSPGKPEPTPVDSVRQQTTEQDPKLETLREELEADVQKQVQDTTKEQIDTSMDALRDVLENELAQGRLQLENDRKRIIIRVEEKGSFPSGSAEMTPEFQDMLDRIATVLAELPGEITIEGHTDNIPINTSRFQSNWDLSAARASSVANALLYNETIKPERMRVQGYAETRPRASNEWPETRALNRRVEIILDLSGSIEEYETELRRLMEEDLGDLIQDLELHQAPASQP
ncbi:MAG: flagellar motor protein MotB [Pseudomonadota bacterium]|jgi:chemotaxis protein MotB|uniref:flagellar motor protein MotB n=1 Tax=Halopseudomonas aestusnigri TaxID=857252 RepID=UPI000C8D511E|nr:type VI secretion system protein TssL [Pseudomonadales bacterium]MCC4262028.1 flagellar motor protein MotB [Halopseudomonas aestusnigri]MEE2800501.1 flagellar motor protein MotB [Pseudomonadota bacterium]HBT57159.1 type VI secretion system protein TssL [Pseudomonas sp.]MAP76192.1 type VI secretion system protein TssL [Pseudomonadales bacterium]|tara:strand:- start:10244 stop:11158 length:915 start_codon:yes stop_codon:yes gene_type:complete